MERADDQEVAGRHAEAAPSRRPPRRRAPRSARDRSGADRPGDGGPEETGSSASTTEKARGIGRAPPEHAGSRYPGNRHFGGVAEGPARRRRAQGAQPARQAPGDLRFRLQPIDLGARVGGVGRLGELVDDPRIGADRVGGLAPPCRRRGRAASARRRPASRDRCAATAACSVAIAGSSRPESIWMRRDAEARHPAVEAVAVEPRDLLELPSRPRRPCPSRRAGSRPEAAPPARRSSTDTRPPRPRTSSARPRGAPPRSETRPGTGGVAVARLPGHGRRRRRRNGRAGQWRGRRRAAPTPARPVLAAATTSSRRARATTEHDADRLDDGFLVLFPDSRRRRRSLRRLRCPSDDDVPARGFIRCRWCACPDSNRGPTA